MQILQEKVQIMRRPRRTYQQGASWSEHGLQSQEESPRAEGTGKVASQGCHGFLFRQVQWKRGQLDDIE